MEAIEKTGLWKKLTFFQIYLQLNLFSSESCLCLCLLSPHGTHAFRSSLSLLLIFIKINFFFLSLSQFSWETFQRNLLSIERQTRQCSKWSSRWKKLDLHETENCGGIWKTERSSLLKLCGKVKRSSDIEILRLSFENCVRKNMRCRNAGNVRERDWEHLWKTNLWKINILWRCKEVCW